MRFMEEYERQIKEQIWNAVHCLYDCSGSIGIIEIPEHFPDENSQLGLSEAIDAGVIINEQGRVQLRQDVFFALFEERMGVAC
jgi:hypothetical protein